MVRFHYRVRPKRVIGFNICTRLRVAINEVQVVVQGGGRGDPFQNQGEDEGKGGC